MSISHQTFLQEQINKLEIEVAQLKGLIKALLDSTSGINKMLEDLDNRIPIGSKDI